MASSNNGGERQLITISKTVERQLLANQTRTENENIFALICALYAEILEFTLEPMMFLVRDDNALALARWLMSTDDNPLNVIATHYRFRLRKSLVPFCVIVDDVEYFVSAAAAH